MENKSVQIGKIIKKKDGKKTMKLGQDNPNNPKYNYTVQIRVLDTEGKVIAKATNPWVTLNTPNDRAPESIVNELSIFPDQE